jgi:hypothetical protein
MVSVHGVLALSLWAYSVAEHHGEAKLLPKKEREGRGRKGGRN